MLSYAIVIFTLLHSAFGIAIWPQPTHVQSGIGIAWVHPNMRAVLKCGDGRSDIAITRTSKLRTAYHQYVQPILQFAPGWRTGLRFLDVPATSLQPQSEEAYIRSAVQETLDAVLTSKFVPWKFYPRRTAFEPDISDSGQQLVSLDISQAKCSSTSFNADGFFNADESYSIKIEDGVAALKANSTIGTMRGLETFKQLFYRHSSNGRSYTACTPLVIHDQPRWPYRGLSLDIARNPFSVEDVIRTIDAMATVKLNRLHVHATDSQSWPIEIPSLPLLAAKGAYQPNLVWTPQDLAYVQNQGVRKGVQVFLELDMPGHTASIAHAYPELIAGFNELDWSTFAAEPLSGQLKLNSSSVDGFLDTLFDDLLPRLRPYNSLYHLGGDEVNSKIHLLDETIRSDQHDDLQPYVQSIMQRIYNKVVESGLHPLVWEEVILEWDLELVSEKDSQVTKPLVQAWRSSDNIATLLGKGYPVLFGDSQHYYLDCGLGVFLDPYPSGLSPPGVPYNTSGGLASRLQAPYLDYCAPYHNWRAMYTFNPLQGIPTHLHQGIQGGETLMWSEQTDGIDLDLGCPGADGSECLGVG